MRERTQSHACMSLLSEKEDDKSQALRMQLAIGASVCQMQRLAGLGRGIIQRV